MLLLICFLVLSFVKLSTDMHKIIICLLISADSNFLIPLHMWWAPLTAV